MSTDLRTEINDADDATGWAGDGNAPAVVTLTGQFYEGSGSIGTQHTNSPEHVWTTQTSGGGGTFSIDLSASTVHVLVKDNLVDTYANGGARITLGDGTNDGGWIVGGNNARGLALDKFFNAYKLDVSLVVAGAGGINYTGSAASLNEAAVTSVGYGSLHLAKAQGNVDNVFVDRITYHANNSYALRINGGTAAVPETMSDVAADDVTNGWGLVNNPVGSQYGIFGSTEWGEPSANADVYFSASGEQWYLIGDNGGGLALADGSFIFRVVGNATDTIDFRLTNVTIVNSGSRADFDFSDANVDVLQLDTVIFTNLATVTLPDDATNVFINDSTFNFCGKTIAGSIDQAGNTWNAMYEEAQISLDEASSGVQNAANLIFNADSHPGSAVELNPSGAGPFTFNFDNWKFNGFSTATGGDTFPTVTSVTNTTITASTSHVVSLPGSISSGDLLLAIGHYNTIGGPTVTPPAGWRTINVDFFKGSGSASTRANPGISCYYVFARKADGTEGSTATFTSASSWTGRYGVYQIAANSWTGDIDTAIETSDSSLNIGVGSNTYDPDWTSKLPGRNNRLAIWHVAQGQTTSTITSSGFSNVSQATSGVRTLWRGNRNVSAQLDDPAQYGTSPGNSAAWDAFVVYVMGGTISYSNRAVRLGPNLISSDADVTINILNGGDVPEVYLGLGYTGTVSVVSSVNVKVVVQDTDGNPIQNAKVFLETTPGGVDIISYGITDVNGEVSTTYGGTTPVDVTGFVRKGGWSPVYKSANINDTIGTTGLTATITLVSDE